MMRLISMRSSKGGLRCLNAAMTIQQQRPQHLPAAMQMLPQQYHSQTVSATAATTGAQKRALQHNQISPSTKVPPTATTASAAGSGVAAAASVSADNNNTIMIGAAVAAGAVGAGYYYYTTTTKKDDITPKAESPKEVVPLKVEDTKTTVTTTEAPTPTTSADMKEENRVTSIIVPSKMKNTSSASSTGTVIEVEDHPPQGNRVTNVVSLAPTVVTGHSSEPAPVTESVKEDKANSSASSSINTKSTHEAIQELQSHTTASAMESLISSHQSMWSSNDGINVGSDHPSSNNSATIIAQLQQRIGQLQYELQDRTKWEAIRLKEFLIMKEKEVTDQLRSIQFYTFSFFYTTGTHISHCIFFLLILSIRTDTWNSCRNKDWSLKT
jgi:hypothetical protein